jgi:predicted permease
MGTLLQDLRHALRGFGHAPAFSVVAILTLALGIGANAAVFTLAEAVLFRPLPFPDEHRLVRITSDLTGPGIEDDGVAVPELDDYRDAAIFASVAGAYRVNANLTGETIATPERIEGLIVTPDYFTVLGAQPAVGRLFDASDATPGIADVTVISHRLWVRLFDGDPGAVGRTILLDTDRFTIVGVLPESFRHPGRGLEGEPVMFAPSEFAGLPFGPPTRLFASFDSAIGRLRDGVSFGQARDQVAGLGAALRATHPEAYEHRGWRPRIEPLRASLVGDVRPPLLVLLSAVGAVLLIACANVAGLLLARNAGRQHEFAVRRALGATPARLGRQLLTESLLLGLAGGAAGLLVASWLTSGLSALIPSDVPRAESMAFNGAVLLFTFGLSIATGLLFGLLPALGMRQGRTAFFLRGRSRGAAAGHRQARARSVLVVAEVALALMLLVSAALLLRSFDELTSVDPGFEPDGVLAARIWLPKPNDPSTGPYFTQQQQTTLYRRALEDVRALPGVISAGWASWLPLGGERRNAPFFIEGQPGDAPAVDAEPFLVSDGYFETLGIPLLRGRLFTPGDDADAPPALVISQSLARRYFPNENPIGRRLHRDLGPGIRATRYTVVGVVGDVHTSGLHEAPPPQLYRSVWQWSDLAMVLMTRTAGDPAAFEGPIRQAISRVDPQLPLFSVRPMTDVLANTFATRRFATTLTGAFSVLAVLLTCVGLYGVVSYLVEQRRNEIGIRVALGAQPIDIVGMVVGGGLSLAVLGVAAGVAGALVLTRLLGGLLYGVSPVDIVAFGGTAAGLLALAAAACAVPARRAAALDPVDALRQE